MQLQCYREEMHRCWRVDNERDDTHNLAPNQTVHLDSVGKSQQHITTKRTIKFDEFFVILHPYSNLQFTCNSRRLVVVRLQACRRRRCSSVGLLLFFGLAVFQRLQQLQKSDTGTSTGVVQHLNNQRIDADNLTANER